MIEIFTRDSRNCLWLHDSSSGQGCANAFRAEAREREREKRFVHLPVEGLRQVKAKARIGFQAMMLQGTPEQQRLRLDGPKSACFGSSLLGSLHGMVSGRCHGTVNATRFRENNCNCNHQIYGQKQLQLPPPPLCTSTIISATTASSHQLHNRQEDATAATTNARPSHNLEARPQVASPAFSVPGWATSDADNFCTLPLMALSAP